VKLLYVTDRSAVGDDAFEGILESLRGAAGLLVELRERGTTDRETLRWAGVTREKLGPGVPLLVNRRLDVALASGAAGVHLPADGLPVSRVRAASPRGLLVGASTHATEEAVRAIEERVDVVVIGPVFQTPSKASYGAPLGTASLAALPPLQMHGTEVFAIGGIDESRLDELARFGNRISGVAGIRLVQEARDPRRVIERIARL
jgi:thiamine-phosphate pyrophosphorylase